ncbi:MAG: phytanoyl-CoA dioxygenase family protein [Planctomycetes bacterium]|nr:phytanoyl-CoA dioxygenase family protein [Planctomycetota bacterium]
MTDQPAIRPLTDAERYLFDLQGFVILRQVVPAAQIAAANTALAKIEALPTESLPKNVTLGAPRFPHDQYFSGVLDADPCFADFIDVPDVLAVIAALTGGMFRLNHAYSITRSTTGYTGLHMGGTPLVHQTHYGCVNGQLYSPLTKAVFPLLPCGPEDGCFAAIPGSHKSNFPRPWGNHPHENPPLVPVIADPGDAIIFSEAVAHGSMVNTSGRLRRTLYFCYSHSWMADWGSQNQRFTSELMARLPERRRRILALSDASGAAPAPVYAQGAAAAMTAR